jgi:hypothetical protein
VADCPSARTRTGAEVNLGNFCVGLTLYMPNEKDRDKLLPLAELLPEIFSVYNNLGEKKRLES